MSDLNQQFEQAVAERFGLAEIDVLWRACGHGRLPSGLEGTVGSLGFERKRPLFSKRAGPALLTQIAEPCQGRPDIPYTPSAANSESIRSRLGAGRLKSQFA